MTDRELLELAALAAGIEWQSYHMSRGLCLTPPKGGMVITQMWNPLTDDGAALRLAVKLRLEIDVHHTGIAVRTPYGNKELVYAEDEPDAYVATRRAIVRAAAEIGKSMTTA